MSKYNGKKRAMDWLGCRIEIVRDMRNGYAKIPAHSKGLISSAGSPKGLHIDFDKCEHCGIAMFISGVNYYDIEDISDL